MAIDGKVLPGKNPRLVTRHFSASEKSILNRLSTDWYITNGGGEISLGSTSSYKYFVMAPTEIYKELFNIEREIVVVFSNYTKFESRSLDAFDHICTKYANLRFEKICYVMISKDKNIEKVIDDLIKRDPENQIIIPFYFDDLLESKGTFYFRNHFKQHFYSRDLFAFQSPLKKDLYFFGRTDLVHKIVNRHRANENSGIFGLRKTGKTSLIFGVQRVIKRHNGVSVFIDCQDPSFHKRHWNKALFYIIDEINKQTDAQASIEDEDKYTEENASRLFEKDLLQLHRHLSDKNILLIFDEIERITYQVSPSDHWKNGLDFVYFWQALRSLFQKHDNIFSYLIVGTNPKCVETPTIVGQDNPIYSQIPYDYIPPFEVSQTREMVRKLGRIMGLKFDETIYSKLTEDFGGHPFIIRIVCSAINEIADSDRPVRVDNYVYKQGKDVFERNYTNYIKMILTVLDEYFSDESEMLKYLALGDYKSFKEFADYSGEYTNHLLGYNIIDENNGRYFFKIESVKDYLINANKYQKLVLNPQEQLLEISERRNILEPKLRKIVRTILQAHLGMAQAKNATLDIMGGDRKAKYSHINYRDLFNPNKSEIYLEDLRKIILKYWNFFENIFDKNRKKLEKNLETLNKYRIDAHAKEISDDEFLYFRLCITELENQVQNYIE